MAKRPYGKCGFNELRKLFEENRSDPVVIKDLLGEIAHRKKNKAIPEFRKELVESLASLGETFEDKEIAEPRPKKKSSAAIKKPPQKSDSQDKCNLEVEKPPENIVVPSKWDSEQRTVIELHEGAYKIVEAGPGAGKTAVACARVAHLIEHCGLEASKIFLISFTRTAVKELRDRITAFAKNPISVAGLRIFTLDSFTWQVLSGLGDDESHELMASYEGNIKKLIQQLRDEDTALLDFLEEFEHVVLDEGQDLVGDRADLAIEIVKHLEDDCGVTVFADSAQAIYGFTDDSEEHGRHHSLTLVQRILQGDLDAFERLKLVNVHRTSDKKLRKLFIEGRDRLLDRAESDISSWQEMKGLIAECAHGEVGKVEEQDLEGKTDHLVLFRTRAEVLMESSFLWDHGVAHKLRMSGTPVRVLPWISKLLSDWHEDILTQQSFEELWSENAVELRTCTAEKAWKLLLDNVGDKEGRVRVVRLREILSRERPPIDFLVDEFELAGPTLGTIHASKGREANQVHLMLPPDSYMDEGPSSKFKRTPIELAEEERVLFVGATRAKEVLKVGLGKKMYASRYERRRTHKPPRKGANSRRMVEIGLSGDVDYSSLADGRLGEDHQLLQDWLWAHCTDKVELEARYIHEHKCNVLFTKDEDRPVAALSNRFSNDLWGIANKLASKNGKGKLQPPGKISHIRMVGVTTVVIPESDREVLAAPWRHTGFILAPVITGFPTISFYPRKGKK